MRLGAPGAMATSPPLLYEVYLHAEHEEEERGVSPEEARAEESASASTDGFVVESANTSRTAVRLARRTAVRDVLALSTTNPSVEAEALSSARASSGETPLSSSSCSAWRYTSYSRGGDVAIAPGAPRRTQV